MAWGWRGSCTPRVRRVKPLGVQWGRLHVSAMIHGRTDGMSVHPRPWPSHHPYASWDLTPYAPLVFLATAENNACSNPLFFRLRVDRRRSDIPGFFTDMQVSSPTALAMSVKIPNFLHRHPKVGEGF